MEVVRRVVGKTGLVAAMLCACAHEPKPAPPTAAARQTTLVAPASLAACERLREGTFKAQLRALEAEQAFQVLADATCFSFVVERGLEATVTLQPSEGEPVAEWTWREFFNAVVAELERQGVVVREDGIRRYRVSAVR